MSDRPVDPYTRHRFAVDVEGLSPMGFSEVRGLSVRVEAAGSGDGDERERRPAASALDAFESMPAVEERETASPRLTLRRGATDDRRLWDWLADWVEGRVKPRNVEVYLLDSTGTRGRGWCCLDARPVRWQGPELVAGSPAVATETLELAHAGIEAVADGDADR